MPTYAAVAAFIPRFYDTSGNPLSGGTVSAFLAGTSTPTPMYTDINGGGSATVLTCDSAGYPAVSNTRVMIFTDISLQYDFLVKNSSGVTQENPLNYSYVNNVSYVNTIALLKAISSPANNSLVWVSGYYTAGDNVPRLYKFNSGSSATDNGGTVIAPNAGSGRWIAMFNDYTINDFGAHPTGATATQNTAAISKAISAITSGDRIKAFAGVYQINDEIANAGKSFVLEGVPAKKYDASTWTTYGGGTVIKQTATDKNLFNLTTENAVNKVTFVRLAGMLLHGNREISGTAGYGIYADGRDNAGSALYLELDNVNITKCKYQGIFLQGGIFDWTFNNVFIYQCGRNGVYMTDTSTLFSQAEGAFNGLRVYECGLDYSASWTNDFAHGVFLNVGKAITLNDFAASGNEGEGLLFKGQSISGSGWEFESNKGIHQLHFGQTGTASEVVVHAAVSDVTINLPSSPNDGAAGSNGLYCTAAANAVTIIGLEVNGTLTGTAKDIKIDSGVTNTHIINYKQSAADKITNSGTNTLITQGNKIYSNTTAKLRIESIAASGTRGAELELYLKNGGGGGDSAGAVTFNSINASSAEKQYARIEGATVSAVAGAETGALISSVMAAGTLTDVFKVDSSTTATHTRMLVYDVDNGTLERVTVGAADSGGAGFKVLRIPN